MTLPLGRWMTAATGAGIALFGVFQWYRAASRNKTERVDLAHARLRGVIIALGTFGFLARGVLFGLDRRVSDPRRATLRRRKRDRYRGSAQCTEAAGIRSLAAGRGRGGIVICYGFFQILKEPYRKFRTS
jgi:hypothetical protein